MREIPYEKNIFGQNFIGFFEIKWKRNSELVTKQIVHGREHRGKSG
jgi:hypothetical protein